MDTFEQKIRLADLEDKGEDTALVRVSDLVELLNRVDKLNEVNETWCRNFEILERKYEGLLTKSILTKPCNCSKYLDLRG